ncbi:MAG: plastocyanin/azurin family copper-binding protein [Sphingomicrobium sp.]
MARDSRIASLGSLGLVAVLMIAPAAARNIGKTAEQPVNLVDYKFEPGTIHLAAGRAVILRLTNSAQQPHEFAAPAFFAGARIRPSDAKSINKEGEAEVGPGQHVDIALVPKAGTYHLQCNKPGHAALGMRGTIVVK